VAEGSPDSLRHSEDGFVQQFITGAPSGPITS
jgi:hypothetical protein